MVQTLEQYQERRRTAISRDTFWDAMTPEQKMAYYRLQGYGYRLLFVRQMYSGPLAIVAQHSQLATINWQGDIDLQPEVKLRA
ncbi:hypothetical protein KDN34_01470 [Shewanella yunxiaonensis]|uniref:DUF4224 domain-containing protein n=1 Tax=Shewanella yunxiaonensis TaxID=2829809 RepID=A0ABX7YU39_9GAMM|nr:MULTISPECIES: hypothetical protein [Shewanella]MDF0535158.1 hypothetical protein [Shewanella sp. A32]QUN06172.1 hypothetical protein KDN34_01470 [Shewanella yunxiaonensis]